MKRVATTKQHQAELENLEAARASQRVDDIRTVASTPQGRRFLMWLVEDEALLTSVTSDTTHGTLAYREGQRSVGIAVLRAVQSAANDRWIEAINERSEAHRIDQLIRQKAEEEAEGYDE